MKRFSCIVFLLLFVVYFICFRTVLSHVLFYHEQHHLFLYTADYFRHIMHTEGIGAYITHFVEQFFHIPLLGSVLVAAMLTSIAALIYRLVWLLTGLQDRFFISLLPSLWLFFHVMTVENTFLPVVGTFLALSAVTILAGCVRNPIIPTSFFRSHIDCQARLWRIVPIACICIYSSFAVWLFFRRYNRSERILLVAEQAVKEGDWDKVLDFTENYMRSGRQNHLVCYFYHLALYHTKGLEGHLFDISHKWGVEALYFPWRSNSRESEYGHFLYEELGYINEAQRWEFEAMTVWGETAPHLINLARYAICNDRPHVAQRYINKLKQSLFYRRQAQEMEQHIADGAVPELKVSDASNVESRPAQFANVMNIGPELEFIYRNDPSNRMAYDYLMADLLLSNHVTRFVEYLPKRQAFDRGALPPAYEEALYIYRLKVGDEAFNELGFTLSPNIEDRFHRYYTLMQSKQWKALQEEFGHTYWFYLKFLSPYGDKVIME
jgi:hypothetical protein